MNFANRLKKSCIFLMTLFLAFSSFSTSVSADQLSAGAYDLNATLRCYVNAMGGVEFGTPLLIGTQLIVNESGSESLKLTFSKNSVTIYSVTCDTFVDAAPSYVTDDRGVTNGTIGIYDSNGNLVTEGVDYTLSEDTALNASDEAVHYVETMTLPIDSRRDTYNLTMYINSNVMGVQFCNENDQAEATTYPATLSVAWDSLSAGASGQAETEETVPEDTAAEDSAAQTEEITGAEVETDTASEVLEAEEMDGLTLYGAEEEDPVAAADTIVVREAGINSLALGIMLAISAGVFVTGAVLYFSAKRRQV